jgi:hypothetical protein
MPIDRMISRFKNRAFQVELVDSDGIDDYRDGFLMDFPCMRNDAFHQRVDRGHRPERRRDGLRRA